MFNRVSICKTAGRNSFRVWVYWCTVVCVYVCRCLGAITIYRLQPAHQHERWQTVRKTGTHFRYRGSAIDIIRASRVGISCAVLRSQNICERARSPNQATHSITMTQDDRVSIGGVVAVWDRRDGGFVLLVFSIVGLRVVRFSLSRPSGRSPIRPVPRTQRRRQPSMPSPRSHRTRRRSTTKPSSPSSRNSKQPVSTILSGASQYVLF